MSNKKKVGIVGYGYLGKAFARFFQDHYDVFVYDVVEPTVEDGVGARVATKEDINACDLAVVCVPTVAQKNGEINLSAVYEVFRWLQGPLVVIKSAVVPGTVNELRMHAKCDICVSPEYMGESKYFTPFWKYPHPTDGRMHNFLVMGGSEPSRSKVIEFFLRVMGPDCRVIKMTSTEAEIVKYMENSWGATKVTFANEFFEICSAFGADYQTVREGFLADGRVERMHTMVLSDSRGFGGKCFPKDVSAIYHASVQKGYEPKLLKQVLKSNEDFHGGQS